MDIHGLISETVYVVYNKLKIEYTLIYIPVEIDMPLKTENYGDTIVMQDSGIKKGFFCVYCKK